MNEEWRDVVGYEGIYLVSNYGNIKRVKTNKVLKPEIRNKYLTVGLTKESNTKHKKNHRAVAEAFIPNPDNKPFVNHIDGNKFNNYSNNLEWVTAQENIDHALENNLFNPRGESSPTSKLNNEQVLEIRKLAAKGYKTKHLAIMFNMCKDQINNIKSRRQWKHI